MSRNINQTADHRKQNGKLGNARTPAGGYTLNQLMGAIGIKLVSGIVNTTNEPTLESFSLLQLPSRTKLSEKRRVLPPLQPTPPPTEVPQARTTGCRVRYEVPHSVSIGQGRMGRFTAAHNLRYEPQFPLLDRRLMRIVFAVYFYTKNRLSIVHVYYFPPLLPRYVLDTIDMWRKIQRSVEFNHDSRKVGFVRRTDGQMHSALLSRHSAV